MCVNLNKIKRKVYFFLCFGYNNSVGKTPYKMIIFRREEREFVRYRELGKTGLTVSEIGLGGEWLERHNTEEVKDRHCHGRQGANENESL